ncbi:MAG: UvrD-helicase domain-containing protein [Candidatus Omnitrophica bacterium]|nr:UvrD-helicase domain-containing protein [Candidatus Omnitrophota bacterium]
MIGKDSILLEDLNPQQIEAVIHEQGPLLIIAGAGTGKTTVITRRIAYLIKQGLAEPDEILALTFTDKAANEMEERVDMMVPYGYTDIWISTFHAFGDRILRENTLLFGLNPDFKVLTQAEAAVFLREHLFEFDLSYYRPLTEPNRYISAFISIFSRLRDDDISPQEYIDYVKKLLVKSAQNPQDKELQEYSLQQKEIAFAYAKYLELLEREGKVDFGNQFYLVLKLFRQHPLILKRYQDRFKYILIDEFQDTNFAQYQLVKLLAWQSRNITVVADDDQCIYRWRGAAYSNVLSFIQDFPEAKKISLLINYRSNQSILDSAYRLIQYNNPDRFEIKANINKKLVALKQGEGPQVFCFDTHLAETDFVAKTIKKMTEGGNFRYNDFAILVRSNSDARGYIESLNMLGVPVRFSGNEGLYQQDEIRLCINFLRFIISTTDSLALFYLLSSEPYTLDMEDLTLCMHYAKRRSLPLYHVFKNLHTIEEIKGLKKDTFLTIERFLKDTERFLELSRHLSVGRLLYTFLKESGYLAKLIREQSLENEIKVRNLARFFSMIRDFELVAKDNRAITFINHLDLLIEAGDVPAQVEVDLDVDAVNVLTVHKAKGLEFRVVFLVNLVMGCFPLYHRSQPIEIPEDLIKEALPEGDAYLQEERRLFYVGMTRAKEKLYFTYAHDYGGSRRRKPSQFIIEALGKEIIKEEEVSSSWETISRFSSEGKAKIPFLTSSSQKGLLTLSYFQIDDYLTCPLKYKYVHILRIPIMEHHTVLYGRAMHEAVTRYLRYKINGQNPKEDFLIRTFEEVFKPEGFLCKEHQEEKWNVAKKALLRFYHIQEESGRLPNYIEKDFSFIYENNRIIGRFDRIDIEPDGGIITDFKSSDIVEHEDADRRTKDSLQLKVYTLAYKEIFKEYPKEVRLYFLESGITGRAKFSDKDLDKTKKKILEASYGIRHQIFEAKPDYINCQWCAYNSICKYALLAR